VTLTGDLFERGEPRFLDLPDSEIRYWRCVDLGARPDLILQELIGKTPWRSEVITLWGKEYQQPRLTAWFGDPGASYTYSGLSLEPLPWTDLLSDIRSRVEALAKASFNSVLLNYYRDHRDSMGMHSDDEPELGRNPTIASVSLGEQRTLVLKHKFRKELKPFHLPLDSCSLLLMAGATQHSWKHGINKSNQPCGPRVNLTFRRIVASQSAP
jgi:alkylated DNA repair dioxygenase AlkB